MYTHWLLLILNLFLLNRPVNAQPVIHEIDARSVAPVRRSVIDMKGSNPQGLALSVNSQYFEKEGKPWFPLMGEMHYNRVRPADWEAEIRKMKSGGLGIVATYIFWNEHETARGVWDWKANRDLRRFVELCHKNGMYVWLRIGPWSHGEQLHGGFPDWIQQMKGKRTNDPAYLAEAAKLYQQIGQQVRGLYFRDGGPIIGVQLENEYASGQAEHISELKRMALAATIQPVYWTVTANTVFDDQKMEVIPLQGSYPYRGWEKAGGGPTPDFLYGDDQWIMTGALGKVFYDPTKFPRGLCEQGCGSQTTLRNRFVVEPHIVEAHLQNQIGRGMNLIGYYMFHGGTQTPGLEEPGLPRNYDFQAPIGEFGLLRPAYRHLKILHQFVNDFGSDLAPMPVIEAPNPVRDVRNTSDLRYVARTDGRSGFLFLNNAQVRIPMPDRDATMRVTLPNETITFPTIRLNGQTSPILPFNVNAGGVLLKYVTAQPFAKVVNGNHTTLFFQKLPGVVPQLSISTATTKPIAAPGWTVKTTGDQTGLTATTGTSVQLMNEQGNPVTLVFLSRSEAENAWRTKLSGNEVLLITDADVVLDDRGVTLRQASNPTFTVRVYPAGLQAFADKPSSSDKQSIFDMYTFSVKPVSANVTIRQPEKGKATIDLPAALPPNVSDLLLSVDYLGGSCVASQNGTPVTDHLFNGPAWQMGLKRYVGHGPLSLAVQDWNDAITGVPDAVVRKIKADGVSILKMTASPQYRIDLRQK